MPDTQDIDEMSTAEGASLDAWEHSSGSPPLTRKTVQVAVNNWLRTQCIDENNKVRLSPSTWALVVGVALIWIVAVPYSIYLTLQ